jgi:ATP synthase protein I
MNDRQDRKAFYRELGRYSALGFEMALSVVIGLGIGYYLDKWLGTAPWLMILWLGFGFAAGVRSLYRAAKRSEREQEEREKDEEGRGTPGGR